VGEGDRARVSEDGETFFRFLAEHVPHIVYSAGSDGTSDWYNRRWYAYTGLTPAESLRPGAWDQVVHPDDIAAAVALWATLRADEGGPGGNEIELRLRRADGVYRRHLVAAAPMRDASGRIVRWFGTGTDVHDAHAERERLREAEATFRSIAQELPQIVWTNPPEGGIDWFNRGFYDYTGLDPAAGVPPMDLWRHPDDAPESVRRWAASLAGGTPYEMELRLRGADGAWRWFLARVVPHRTAAGEIDRWFGTATDVDERRRQRDELERLYARERRLAEQLQLAFLPDALPEVERLAFDAVYRPAAREAELGGDWYDAFVLGDGRVALSIGDVIGHGLDAATVMVRARETLRATGWVSGGTAEVALANADSALRSSHPDMLATAIFAVIDVDRATLTYACAGHPAPTLVRDGQARSLPGGGTPLGLDASYDAHAVTLRAGDVLYFYTDGLIEARRDAIEGEQRLLDTVCAGGRTTAQIVAAIMDGVEQRDDIALLSVRVADVGALPAAPPRGWRFASDDAASANRARDSFVGYLRTRGTPPDRLQVAELVFGELVGNVVRHAPGPIEVALEFRDELAVLSVRDTGPPFQPVPVLPDDLLSTSGRGLFLVATYATPPAVIPYGDGKEVVVSLPR
jgi:PAS domain S-box-containing protein